MNHRSTFVILTILAVALCFSCGERVKTDGGAPSTEANVVSKVTDNPKELTREKAVKLLEKANRYPRKETTKIIVAERREKVGSSVEDLLRGDQRTARMKEAGLVDIAPTGSATHFGTTYDTFEIRMLPGSEKYILRQGPAHPYSWATEVEVHACEAYIKEVTGIEFSGEGKRAKAEMKIGFRGSTPFGDASDNCRGGTEIVEKAFFKLWDDGWRALDENPFWLDF